MKKVTKEEMSALPKIVAVDFDGTLVEDHFPQIGPINEEMFELCKQLKDQGIALILWTSRDDYNVAEAVAFCAQHGLVFDAVNENLKEVQALFNNDTRKVYADLYIDDKAIPHTMSPSFWAERLGLRFILGKGVEQKCSCHCSGDCSCHCEDC